MDHQPEDKLEIASTETPAEQPVSAFEMTPSPPAEKADTYEELTLSPSLSAEEPDLSEGFILTPSTPETQSDIFDDLTLTPSLPEEEDDLAGKLILTPSLSGEKPGNDEMVLEAGSIFKAEEITFEGEDETEDRVGEAMAAYDKAMDQAAGLKKKY